MTNTPSVQPTEARYEPAIKLLGECVEQMRNAARALELSEFKGDHFIGACTTATANRAAEFINSTNPQSVKATEGQSTN